MPLLTIPNVSEGRDEVIISRLSRALELSGCRVLDVHVDTVHNRSVFTATGSSVDLVGGLGALAGEAVSLIDLHRHKGAHPRVGVLDVCPIVPHFTNMKEAVEVAHETGKEIVRRARLPVYFYGEAGHADPPRDLPDVRAGGLERLVERASAGFAPDLGPRTIDARSGVVCVGARGTLIAFNVWIEAPVDTARRIAAVVRERDGGLPGVRALGLEMGPGRAQVSMNLTDPERTGIETAFAAVAAEAGRAGATVGGTELVGLVPERYLPSPDAEAARLLIEPGRSLESVLAT